MLHGTPTKNGTGITIFGDFGDLSGLYETVHEIASSLDEDSKYQKGQSQLLLTLAYEIRKAFSGARLTKKVTFDGDKNELQYYGFQCVWTDILIFIATLRHNTGYIQTNKLNQANLYMLEHVVERAMFDYDAAGAEDIRNLIGQRIDITNQYAFILFQALQIRFVSDNPGKKRFRNIPKLMGDYFSEWRQDYKNLMALLAISAKQQKCEINDLDFDEFPEIKW